MRRIAVFLARLCVFGLVALAALVAYRFGEHRLVARRMFLDTIEPVVLLWHGQGFVPHVGPPAAPEDFEKGNAPALRSALATAFPSGTPEILELHNPIPRRSRHEFAYQDLDEPRVAQLRARLDLEAAVEGAQGDLQRIRRLVSHVRGVGTNGYGNFNAIGGEDAIRVLDHAEIPGNELWCWPYALLLVQAAVALGHHARPVSASYWEHRDHALAEIWSDELIRWILVDPQYDLVYVHNGTPLNAYDLHLAFRPIGDAYLRWLEATGRKDWRDLDVPHGANKITKGNFPAFMASAPMPPAPLEVVRGTNPDKWIGKRLASSPTGMNLELFQAFSVKMRNDFLTVRYPFGHPRRYRELSVVAPSSGWLKRYDGHFSQRLADLYWTLNLARLAFEADVGDGVSDEPAIRVRFGTFTPNFKGFKIWVDDQQVRTSDEASFRWRLKSGENKLEVAAFNSIGVEGHRSRVRIRLVDP